MNLFFEFNFSNASCLSLQVCNNLKFLAFKNNKQSNLENNFLNQKSKPRHYQTVALNIGVLFNDEVNIET